MGFTRSARVFSRRTASPVSASSVVLSLIAAALLAPGLLYAQSSTAAADAPAADAPAANTALADTAASGSFFDDSTSGVSGGTSADGARTGGAAGVSGALAINGRVEALARSYLSSDDLAALGNGADGRDRSEVNARSRLEMNYRGAATELNLKLNLDSQRFSDHPEDLLDEAYTDAYLGDLTLEAGKEKLVWGKGDELHVVDLINANDYTDYIFPKYVDRRLGETLVHLSYSPSTLSVPLRLEAVWSPTMTVDRIPSSGPWVPAEAIGLQNLLTSYVGYQYVTLYGSGGPVNTLKATEYLAAHSSASAFLPNTLSLDYGQYAFRGTGTIGALDWGVSYYLGHFKTPSVTYTSAASTVTSVGLTYDRLQALGLEGAFALGPWNFRLEGAYYLTDDTAGTDAAVKNNRLAWVFGFDIDLPLHNLNVNLQTQGTYLLGSPFDTPLDVDYNADGYRSDDRIVLKLSDSFNHERVKPALRAIWGVEHAEYLVNPELEWKVADDLSLKAEGAWFLGGSGGLFDAFKNNDFARLTARYEF